MLRAWLAGVLVTVTPCAWGGVFLSTTTNAVVEGLPINNGDLVQLDPPRLELSGHELFGLPVGFNGSNKNLDAISRVSSGWVYSTSTDHTYNGVTYLDGDLVLWRPGIGASLWMSEDVFGGADEDIDALEILQDGRLLLSTDSSAVLGGLLFAAGDVVAYDRATDVATMWFLGADWFDGAENIDALALLGDGSMLFSAAADASIGGWTFRDGDVIRWDGTGFNLWLSESIFAEDEDVDALAIAEPFVVPEPPVVALLALGLVFVIWRQYGKS